MSGLDIELEQSRHYNHRNRYDNSSTAFSSQLNLKWTYDLVTSRSESCFMSSTPGVCWISLQHLAILHCAEPVLALTGALLYCCTLYIVFPWISSVLMLLWQGITWTPGFHCFWALEVWPRAGLSYMNAVKMQWNSVVKLTASSILSNNCGSVQTFVWIWSLVYA